MWADRINDTHLAGSTIEKYLLVLFRFNRYLANKGYYTDSSLEMNIDTMLSRFNAKDRNIGVRKDRYLLGMDEVETYNARKDRIWLHTIVNNKKVYYYSEEDENIITELKPKLKTFDIELIKK